MRSPSDSLSVEASSDGAGLRSAARWIRSVAFLVDSNPPGGKLEPSVKCLVDWLEQFDRWYKNAIGDGRHQQLHLLYHRDVSLVGERLLAHSKEACRLAEAAARCGMGFSITVSLGEALAAPSALHDLIACSGVTTIGIEVTDDLELPAGSRAASLLKAVVQNKGHIGFIGSYEKVRELGLLEYPGVASSQITVHPKRLAAADTLTIPPQPVVPCFSRLRVYVDCDGEVYPCLGLLGVPGASLGSIYASFDQSAFSREDYPLDLDQLARSGPLLGPAPSDRLSGLPWICERHRLGMLAGPAPSES